MLWIKRNLFFVLGAAIAVALLVLGIVSYVGKSAQSAQVTEELGTQWSVLKGFYARKVFPSEKNLSLIASDQQKLARFLADSRTLFKPVPPVPYTGMQSFKSAMDNTLSQLHGNARKSSVLVPTNYYFSFTAHAHRLNFTPQGMRSLAHQMAEIQAFCNILYEAKINRMEAVQRARTVDDQDPTAPDADYVLEPIRTTPLGVVYPYRLTFRCFSSELAAVLEGFMASPHAFVIKTVEIESVPLDAPPLPTVAPQLPPGMTPGTPFFNPGTPAPYPPRTFQPRQPRMPGVTPTPGGGAPGGGRGKGGGGRGGRGAVEPMSVPDYPPTFAPAQVYAAAGFGANTNRGGLVTILHEKPFRVSLYVESVTLR